MNHSRVTAENGAATIVADVYVDAGDRGTVVMLPSYARGAGDFTAAFGSDLAARVAAAGYRVVLPWPRAFGEGLSTGPTDGVTLADLAADVAAVIEGEGDSPVAVVGHAFGNRVARMLATTHPQLVDRLILAAAGGITPTPPSSTDAISTIVFDSEASEDDRIAALAHAFFAPGNDPTVWLEGWDMDVGIIQAAANQPELVTTWWPGGGKVPMYVLQADGDTTASAADSSDILLRDFPDRVEVVTITGAGHAMLCEQPDQVAEAVLDFLSR